MLLPQAGEAASLVSRAPGPHEDPVATRSICFPQSGLPKVVAPLVPSPLENSSARIFPTEKAAAQVYSADSGSIQDAAATGGEGVQPGIKA